MDFGVQGGQSTERFCCVAVAVPPTNTCKRLRGEDRRTGVLRNRCKVSRVSLKMLSNTSGVSTPSCQAQTLDVQAVAEG